MDIKVVSRELRQKIYPILKEQGFTLRKGHKLWRSNLNAIDFVHIRFLSTYNADVIGTTTCSPTIELGTFYNFIPNDEGVPSEQFVPKGGEQCHVRGYVFKGLKQPELARADVWHMHSDGSNLSDVINDMQVRILDVCDTWFSRSNNLHDIYEFIDHKEEIEEGDDNLWGIGYLGSPRRDFLAGYFASFFNLYDVASERLTHALNSKIYDHIADQIKLDIVQNS